MAQRGPGRKQGAGEVRVGCGWGPRNHARARDQVGGVECSNDSPKALACVPLGSTDYHELASHMESADLHAAKVQALPEALYGNLDSIAPRCDQLA